MERIQVSLALLLLVCAGPGETLDLAHAWFEPSLTTNRDPICATAFASTKAKWASTERWDDYDGDALGLEESEPDSLVRESGTIILTSGSTELNVRRVRHGGCGGACEAYALAVSDNALPDSATTPVSRWWSVYRIGEHHYAAGLVEKQLQVYRLTRPREWALSCEIQVEPIEVRQSTETATQIAIRSLDALEAAVTGVGGGSGSSCGSLATNARWTSYFHDRLTQTLFRPWAVKELDRGYRSENSFGDYERTVAHLQTWSLTGLAQHAAFAAYQAQVAATISELAAFYEKKYRWSRVESERMAQSALQAAIALRFGFYMYQPYERPAQLELMAALLDRRPVPEIKRIALNFGTADALDDEALLSVAVVYPEALRYLLENGADPNKGNAFGKTPLMYAAQYDNYAAAEILLEHQADPNATTIQPDDDCYYSLQTTSVTPLHYAVRYASAPLVKLLLEHGAVTFIRTRKGRSPDLYPIDWLHTYSKLADAEIEELGALLRVPDKEKRARISMKMTALAEAEYAAGRPEPAYQALRTALAAQYNRKAAEDLPLVALKSGHLGASLQAADTVIKGNFGASAMARAWFNKGLACEGWSRSRPFVREYNGQYYCQHTRVHPFLVSWNLEPTTARKNKLVELFAAGCSVDKGRTRILFVNGDDYDDGVVSYRYRQMVYIYDTERRTFDPKSLRSGAFSPTLLATHDLGDATISVLSSQAPVQWPVIVGGYERCEKPTEQQ
jgi:hypothetical protein